MDLIANVYLAAFVLGTVHAVEVDHMAAVTVFAGMKPRLLAAGNYGARWGVGHALVVVIVGSGLALFNIKLPTGFMDFSEVLVGLALIALGLWAYKRSKKFSVDCPQAQMAKAADGISIDNHDPSPHQHLPTAMGALHGLAGSAPVLALLPVALLPNMQQVILYLVLFSIGTTLAMSVYALLAAATVRGLRVTQQHFWRLSKGIALASILVGSSWIVRGML